MLVKSEPCQVRLGSWYEVKVSHGIKKGKYLNNYSEEQQGQGDSGSIVTHGPQS